MFNYREWVEEIKKMEPGQGRINFAKAAVAVADREGTVWDAMNVRADFMYAAYYDGDGYDFVLNFPEYMAKMDSLPPEEIGEHSRRFMLSFSNYISCAGRYHQIVKKTINALWEEYKGRCKKYGYSLRTYYHSKIIYNRDIDELPKLLKLFRAEKRDAISYDTFAEFSNVELSSELALGNLENALELEKMYYDSDDVNDFNTYRVAMQFVFFFSGMDNTTMTGEKYKKIKPYLDKMVNYVVQDLGRRFAGDTELLIAANVDLDYALDIWKKLINPMWTYRDSLSRRGVFAASFYLFRSLWLTGENQIEFAEMSEESPLYSPDGIYKTEVLKDWFYDAAMDLSKKLDKSDGGNAHVENLEGYANIVSLQVRRRCDTADIDIEIDKALEAGDIEKALELEKKIAPHKIKAALEEKGLAPDAITMVADALFLKTDYYFAAYYRKNKMHEKTEPYVDRMCDYINRYHIDAVGDIFFPVIFYADFNLDKAKAAWETFCARLEGIDDMENECGKAQAGYYLYKKLGDTEQSEKFYKIAADLSRKIDTARGNNEKSKDLQELKNA